MRFFRTVVEEDPEDFPSETKNENYLNHIEFENLTKSDHDYNSYARPFHEEIPELEHFFGRDETRPFDGLYKVSMPFFAQISTRALAKDRYSS